MSSSSAPSPYIRKTRLRVSWVPSLSADLRPVAPTSRVWVQVPKGWSARTVACVTGGGPPRPSRWRRGKYSGHKARTWRGFRVSSALSVSASDPQPWPHRLICRHLLRASQERELTSLSVRPSRRRRYRRSCRSASPVRRKSQSPPGPRRFASEGPDRGGIRPLSPLCNQTRESRLSLHVLLRGFDFLHYFSFVFFRNF